MALIIPSLIWLASFVTILVTTWPTPPWTLLQWGSVAFMIVFPLAFYPVAHTLAMALDVLVRPPGRH